MSEINLVPPGFPVLFSTFAVPCNHIRRIIRGEDGIGVRVYLTNSQTSYEDDKSTTLKDAVSLWHDACSFSVSKR